MTNNQLQAAPQQPAATYRTGLAKVNDTFMPMITAQLQGNNISMGDYQKHCVLNSLSAIHAVLDAKGLTINSNDFDRDNLTDVLLKVATLELNPAATPREVYFQVRNVKKGSSWFKQIEMGIEGDGNDALLAKFGRDVKTVHQFWAVREGDVFVYPKFRGIEISPPEWEPKGEGNVVRVVYPITKTTGEVEYHIAERADVLKNLVAHIQNNMMNETFGIANDRYKATSEQKAQIEAKKDEIINRVKELGLDGALNQLEETYAQFISPAWKSEQSRESMILRKMRNNITKKIPKDFGNAYVTRQYDEATDEEYARVRKDITENANQIPLDFAPEPEVQRPAQPKVYDAATGEVYSSEIVKDAPHIEQPDMYEKTKQEASFVEPTSGDGEPF